jgi:shikimate kinase
MIARETDMSIPEIFESRGESEFRRLEKNCIQCISHLNHTVVSLGGGSVLDPENWKSISSSGRTITLSYPAKILAARLVNLNDRPLLSSTQDDNRLQRIESLLAERKSYYHRADLILHFNRDVPAEHVVSAITGYLGKSS